MQLMKIIFSGFLSPDDLGQFSGIGAFSAGLSLSFELDGQSSVSMNVFHRSYTKFTSEVKFHWSEGSDQWKVFSDGVFSHPGTAYISINIYDLQTKGGNNP